MQFTEEHARLSPDRNAEENGAVAEGIGMTPSLSEIQLSRFPVISVERYKTLPRGRDFNLTPAHFQPSIVPSCGMAVLIFSAISLAIASRIRS
jgi:hypothetical protein